MGGQVRIRVRYQDMATPYFDYLLVSADELRSLLDGTVWTLEELERDRHMYAATLKKR